MEPTIRRLTADGFAVRKVNIDQQPQLAKQFKVDAVPTYVMVVNGREVKRIVGPTSYAHLTGLYNAAKPTTTLASAPTRNAPTQHPPTAGRSANPKDQAMQATVRLRVEDAKGISFGTGTVIDTHGDEALVITCAHLFRDATGKITTTADLFVPGNQRTVPAVLISSNDKHDVALVSIQPGIKLTPMPVAPAGYQVQQGATVFSIGCDRGSPPSLRDSRVTSLNKYLGPANIEVAGQPVIGRSGGGLFAADGRLIGICNCADPEDDEGIYAALTLVHENLAKIGQSRLFRADNTQLATAPPPASVPVANHRSTPQPPHMPARMPGSDGGGLAPVPAIGQPPLGSLVGLDPNDTEIICIIRSKSNPAGKSRMFIVDQPTPDLHKMIAAQLRMDGRDDPVVLEASRSGASQPPARWSDGPQGNPVIRAQSGR